MLLLGRRLGHRRDDRADGLGVPRDRGQAERGRHLAEEEIDEQQPPGCRGLEFADEGASALLEAIALEKADDGKQYPDDADIAVLVERLAEGGDDGDEIEPGGEAGGKSGDGDDQIGRARCRERVGKYV